LDNVKEYYSLITNTDIADIARELIGDRITDESGDVVYIDCPRHASISHRSLHIDRRKQCWYCFGCNAGGDVLHLVEFIQSGTATKNAAGQMPESHRAARDWLARRAGLPLLSQYNIAPEQIREIEARRAEEDLVFSILTDIADFYHQKLLANKAALAAFKKQYGISDEMIETLKIGYADNNGLLTHLKNDCGRAQADIMKTGCFLTDYQDNPIPFFNNRFTFPYWKQGKVVFLIGRQTRWTEKNRFENSKYKKMPVRTDSRKYISEHINNRYFYNEDSLLGKSDYTIITEGVTDCISLMERGFSTISPVTKTFSEKDHEKLFSRVCGLDRIYVCQDNEISGAGLDGALGTAHFLSEKGLNVLVVELPLDEKQKQARVRLKEEFDILPCFSRQGMSTKKESLSAKELAEADRLIADAKTDVNTYFLTHSTDDFQKLLLGGKTPLQFGIEQIPADLPDDERNKMLEPVIRNLARLKPIEQERYIGIIHSHFDRKIAKKTIQDTIAAVRREEKAKDKKRFHSDAPEGSCKRLMDRLMFETTEAEGKPNWNVVTEGVHRWFKEHGAIFFHDTEQNRYIYFEGQVFSMKPDKNTNPAYLSMLYKHTQLPITASPAGRIFHECFDSIAYNDGDLKEPHYWLYTDRARHTVFFNLNNEKNEILKITPDGIEIIRNGVNADNIVFHHSPTMRPIEYIPDADIAEAEQLFKTLIFDNLACPAEERVLITTWISCFLLLDFAGTRPLLRFEGAAESGKSTASKLLSTLVFGDQNLENPTIAANYTEGAKQPLIVIDNIELKNATDEFTQFLLTAVTGIVRTKRRHGTDTDTVRESVRCLINTSGIEPLAGLSELTTRTLLVDFDISLSTLGYFLESDTLQGIMDARNILLTAIFKKTQMILGLLRDGGHAGIMKLFADELGPHPKRRCNDFLTLMYLMLLVGMNEKEMEKYMGTVHPVFKSILGKQQALSEMQEIESNAIIMYILLLMKERLLAVAADEDGTTHGNLDNFNRAYGLKFTDTYTIADAKASDLFSAFNALARNKGMKPPYSSAAQLSKRIRNDLRIIEKAGLRIEQNKNRDKFLLFTITAPASLVTCISRTNIDLSFEE